MIPSRSVVQTTVWQWSLNPTGDTAALIFHPAQDRGYKASPDFMPMWRFDLGRRYFLAREVCRADLPLLQEFLERNAGEPGAWTNAPLDQYLALRTFGAGWSQSGQRTTWLVALWSPAGSMLACCLLRKRSPVVGSWRAEMWVPQPGLDARLAVALHEALADWIMDRHGHWVWAAVPLTVRAARDALASLGYADVGDGHSPVPALDHAKDMAMMVKPIRSTVSEWVDAVRRHRRRDASRAA